MSKQKPILMSIGNVRIVEYDNANVMVERLEDVVNPSTKEVSRRWRFKGYSSTVQSALRMIVRNELLIDRGAVRDLESHLKQVEQSNAKVLEVIE